MHTNVTTCRSPSRGMTLINSVLALNKWSVNGKRFGANIRFARIKNHFSFEVSRLKEKKVKKSRYRYQKWYHRWSIGDYLPIEDSIVSGILDSMAHGWRSPAAAAISLLSKQRANGGSTCRSWTWSKENRLTKGNATINRRKLVREMARTKIDKMNANGRWTIRYNRPSALRSLGANHAGFYLVKSAVPRLARSRLLQTLSHAHNVIRFVCAPGVEYAEMSDEQFEIWHPII